MRGSVIFSNMLDFAVYEWTACVACPLAAFGGSISPWYYPRKMAETCILWHPGHKGSVPMIHYCCEEDTSGINLGLAMSVSNWVEEMRKI